MLKGTKILLGITGSIAAYKSAALIRLLVKAGAEVGAAPPGVALALQRPQLALRAHSPGVEQRMLESLGANHLRGIGRRGRVQGDEQRRIGGQVLQAVHPVGDAKLLFAARAGATDIVPG